MIDGEPWFHAADACRCLGLNVRGGTGKYMGALDQSEGRMTPVSFGGKGGSTAGIISESGLYKLIMRAQRSRPGVAVFQDWVTKEVLPSIRKPAEISQFELIPTLGGMKLRIGICWCTLRAPRDRLQLPCRCLQHDWMGLAPLSAANSPTPIPRFRGLTELIPTLGEGNRLVCRAPRIPAEIRHSELTLTLGGDEN
ncbi:hypothetical protein GCM10010990_09030 [Croceicoccus mobilis]|uniref:Bro-N domain-containing protein n=2 Tax=Croceicoccus mobilis TaxID=1703339 RepID=A0A917DRH8_9SPHN|nr:hypothetical protein GCM10010990_09030 [Croceicoccus mobilis]